MCLIFYYILRYIQLPSVSKVLQNSNVLSWPLNSNFQATENILCGSLKLYFKLQHCNFNKYKLQESPHKLHDKTPFFVIGPFLLTNLFVLTLASDMAVLYGNDAFPIFELLTRKRCLGKRILFFRKSVSNLRYWKRSIFPLIVTWNHMPQTEGYFENP